MLKPRTDGQPVTAKYPTATTGVGHGEVLEFPIVSKNLPCPWGIKSVKQKTRECGRWPRSLLQTFCLSMSPSLESSPDVFVRDKQTKRFCFLPVKERLLGTIREDFQIQRENYFNEKDRVQCFFRTSGVTIVSWSVG